MAVEAKNDLETFHQFVGQQLANGGSHLSPEQVLAMWRERLETIGAVREGLEAVDAGRTKPLDQFARDFRKRYNISEQPAAVTPIGLFSSFVMTSFMCFAFAERDKVLSGRTISNSLSSITSSHSHG